MAGGRVVGVVHDPRGGDGMRGNDVRRGGAHRDDAVGGEGEVMPPDVDALHTRAGREGEPGLRVVERRPERVGVVRGLPLAAELGDVGAVLARPHHARELRAVEDARQDGEGGEHALRIGVGVELALSAGAPVGVVVGVVAVLEVAGGDDVAAADQRDEVVAQREVRDLHDLALRPVAPDSAFGAEDVLVAGVEGEVGVAEEATRLAKGPEHARRLAVGVELGHRLEALRLDAELVYEREVEAAADERGDLLGGGGAVADHDALAGEFPADALGELGAVEDFPVAALLVGEAGGVEIPAAVFAAHGLPGSGDFRREVAPALLVEKLDDVAVRELLEGRAVLRDAAVELADQFRVGLRGGTGVVGALLVHLALADLPGLALLLALDGREPALAVAGLAHDVELLLRVRVRAVVAVLERPAGVGRLIARLAVVRGEDREGRLVFRDLHAVRVVEGVEKAVPADAELREVHGDGGLVALLRDGEGTVGLRERLEVGVRDLDLDRARGGVARRGDADLALLLVRSLLEDVAAHRVHNLPLVGGFLQRHAEDLDGGLLAPGPETVADELEVERELVLAASAELSELEREAHEEKRRRHGLSVTDIVERADLAHGGVAFVERLLGDVHVAARAAGAELGKLRSENRLLALHRDVGAEDPGVEPVLARHGPVHVLGAGEPAGAREDGVPGEVAVRRGLSRLRLVDGEFRRPDVDLHAAEVTDARADGELRAAFEQGVRARRGEGGQREKAGGDGNRLRALADDLQPLDALHVRDGFRAGERAEDRAVEIDEEAVPVRIGDEVEGVLALAAEGVLLAPLGHELLDGLVVVEAAAHVEVGQQAVHDGIL